MKLEKKLMLFLLLFGAMNVYGQVWRGDDTPNVAKSQIKDYYSEWVLWRNIPAQARTCIISSGRAWRYTNGGYEIYLPENVGYWYYCQDNNLNYDGRFMYGRFWWY